MTSYQNQSSPLKKTSTSTTGGSQVEAFQVNRGVSPTGSNDNVSLAQQFISEYVTIKEKFPDVFQHEDTKLAVKYMKVDGKEISLQGDMS